MKAARHLSAQWRVMHYSIFSLALCGRPLRPEVKREGTRPKTYDKHNRKFDYADEKVSYKQRHRMQQSEKHKTSFPDIPEIPQSIRQKLQADSFSDEPRPSAPVPPPLPGSMGAVELDGRGDDSDLPKADVSALHSRSFPTEQRNRQKARKQAGHVAKKRPQVVEDHHDDCGEDFSRLGEDYVVASHYEGLQHDQSEHLQ